ncbi:Eco57I restriction-modification methylase domain-containing protein, partial [Helicobacter cappadocius]
FEFPEVLDEEGDFVGFDLVIGNPPYIDYRRINDDTKEHLEKTSYSYGISKTASIFVYFIEVADSLIQKRGNIIFINPISYISLNSGKGIRSFIDKNLELISILDISDLKIFDSASTYTCINYFGHKDDKNSSILFGYVADKNLDGIKYKKIEAKYIENLSLFLNPITEKIFNMNYETLNSFCEVFCGLSVAGFREDVGNIKTDKNAPFLEASDISKYNYKQNKFLKRIPFYYSKNKIAIFENSEVIFMSRMTNIIRCCFPPKGSFGGKINVIWNFKIDKKFILGVLNSTLMNYFYTKKYFSTHMQGGAFSFDTLSVGELPIPKIKPKNQKIVNEIISLVDKILKLKEEDCEADISKLEKEIDTLVYKLYNLTDEDIKIIEEG